MDVEVWDGKDIEFSESAIREISQDAALRFGTEEGVLYIQYRSAAGEYTPSVFPEKRLQLRIPRSLAGSLGGILVRRELLFSPGRWSDG